MIKVLRIPILILIVIITIICLYMLLNYQNENKSSKDIDEIIYLEFDENKIKITNSDDVKKFKSTLENLTYDSEICKGEITHKINYNDETYYIKSGCNEIQKENKQAKIAEEDLKALLDILKKNEIK